MGSKTLIIAIVIVAIIGSFILLMPSSVAAKIDKDSEFNYSTSISGSYSSEKANVYTTDMSVPITAAHIMNKSKPESHTNLTDQDNIQLFYDDYYVLVYKGEDSKTYVQVSSREYIHNNGYGRIYRPYHRNVIVFYDKSYKDKGYYNSDRNRYGYGTPNSNKINTNKNSSSKIKTNSNSGSIRNGSSGSRSVFGGGTSFGK